MTALSTKDKLVLRLSRERVERWNRERLKPAKNPVIKDDGTVKLIRCRDTAWGGTLWKEDETILPDRLDAINRASDGYAVRSMASKLLRAEKGQARRGIEHHQGDGDSRQAIAYDPSSEYLGPVFRDAETIKKEHAAMVQHERSKMPARVRRKLGV